MIYRSYQSIIFFFFFNDTATTEIYTLSLHDALPIWPRPRQRARSTPAPDRAGRVPTRASSARRPPEGHGRWRSEEHTSELQSRQYLVCRLLLEKKKKQNILLTVLLFSTPQSTSTIC